MHTFLYTGCNKFANASIAFQLFYIRKKDPCNLRSIRIFDDWTTTQMFEDFEYGPDAGDVNLPAVGHATEPCTTSPL